MKFNKQTVRCKTTCFIWVAIMQRMIGVVNNITTPQHTVLRTFKRNRVKETLVAAVLFSCGLCIYEVHFYSRWWYPGYSSGFLVRLPGFKFRYGRYFCRVLRSRRLFNTRPWCNGYSLCLLHWNPRFDSRFPVKIIYKIF